MTRKYILNFYHLNDIREKISLKKLISSLEFSYHFIIIINGFYYIYIYNT